MSGWALKCTPKITANFNHFYGTKNAHRNRNAVCALRGIAIESRPFVRLSVRLSMTLRYRGLVQT